MLWIDADYRALFKSADLFQDIEQIEGEVFRIGQGRVTLRFERQGQAFFLKRHSGIGWREIFKDLFQGRLPIVGAENEWRALERLEILNVSSLRPIAYGQRGWNPAGRQSFLITKELANTISLEDLVKDWHERDAFIHIKRKIIKQVALLARRIHQHGLNHRDLYICHLHVSLSWLDDPQDEPEIFVIDLHRAQIRKTVPVRWLVKDVASLYFSSMEAGLTQRDYLRFVREYRQMPLREALQGEAAFWQAVQARADRLYATRPGMGSESIDFTV